jgi:hypothetical protein
MGRERTRRQHAVLRTGSPKNRYKVEEIKIFVPFKNFYYFLVIKEVHQLGFGQKNFIVEEINIYCTKKEDQFLSHK